MIGRRILEQYGFEVLTACDGSEAVEIFSHQPQQISAVLLDLTMPNLNGEEVFEELRRRDPDVKVILSSGYDEWDTTRSFEEKGLAGFIQKPYRVDDLIEKIREVLRP